MFYYFRYNKQIHIICILEVVFFYYNYNFEFELYSVFSRIFICLFLLKNNLAAISVHPTAISVPSRNPNAFT
jgi:hypothetical protein